MFIVAPATTNATRELTATWDSARVVADSAVVSDADKTEDKTEPASADKSEPESIHWGMRSAPVLCVQSCGHAYRAGGGVARFSFARALRLGEFLESSMSQTIAKTSATNLTNLSSMHAAPTKPSSRSPTRAP